MHFFVPFDFLFCHYLDLQENQTKLKALILQREICFPPHSQIVHRIVIFGCPLTCSGSQATQNAVVKILVLHPQMKSCYLVLEI